MVRRLTWLLLLAACSSSSAIVADGPLGGGADAPPGGGGSSPADAGPVAFTCPETLDQYCGMSSGCVRRLEDQPKCGVRIDLTSKCGTLTGFGELGVDASR